MTQLPPRGTDTSEGPTLCTELIRKGLHAKEDIRSTWRKSGAFLVEIVHNHYLSHLGWSPGCNGPIQRTSIQGLLFRKNQTQDIVSCNDYSAQSPIFWAKSMQLGRAPCLVLLAQGRKGRAYPGKSVDDHYLPHQGGSPWLGGAMRKQCRLLSNQIAARCLQCGLASIAGIDPQQLRGESRDQSANISTRQYPHERLLAPLSSR